MHSFLHILAILALTPTGAFADDSVKKTLSATSPELDCDKVTKDLMRGLEDIRTSNEDIAAACAANSRIPLNRKVTTQYCQGACECTYTSVRYFGNQVQQSINAACRKVNEAKAEAARRGCSQNSCADLDRQLTQTVQAELAKGKSLLRQAQKALDDRARAISDVVGDYADRYGNPNATPQDFGASSWDEVARINGWSSSDLRLAAPGAIKASFLNPDGTDAREGRLAMEQERAWDAAQKAKSTFQNMEAKFDRVSAALGGQSTITLENSGKMNSLPTAEGQGDAKLSAATSKNPFAALSAASNAFGSPSEPTTANRASLPSGTISAPSGGGSSKSNDPLASQLGGTTSTAAAGRSPASIDNTKNESAGKAAEANNEILAAFLSPTTGGQSLSAQSVPDSSASATKGKASGSTGALSLHGKGETGKESEADGAKTSTDGAGARVAGGMRGAKGGAAGAAESTEDKLALKEKFAESESLRDLLRKRLNERRQNGGDADASATVDEVLNSVHQQSHGAGEQAGSTEKGAPLAIESEPLFRRVHNAHFRFQKRAHRQEALL